MLAWGVVPPPDADPDPDLRARRQRPGNWWRAALRGVLDLTMPRVCVRCEALLGETSGMVCTACWSDVHVLSSARCSRCGHPSGADACAWCPSLPDAVACARSLCWVPEGAGGDLVHKLKYEGWHGLGADLGSRLAHRFPDAVVARPAIVVPVPLGTGRRRERGYNQAEAVARAMASVWRLPLVPGAVRRARETGSQVRLTPGERSANVHGAFAAGSSCTAIAGKHVVLVDDVVTTGATLNACASVIHGARATSISYVTFGRARAAFDRAAHHRSN